MGSTCRFFRAMARFCLLVILAMAWIAPAWGQDLQVIVDGPWSYYKSTNGKWLYLITPDSTYHSVFVYGGLDVNGWRSQNLSPDPQGKYELKGFPHRTNFSGSFEPFEVCNGAVDKAYIKSAINDKANYVIRLPYPDLFSTYIDANGMYSGYSWSKVNPSDPTQPAGTAAPVKLTTTMVLHYGVSSVPSTVTWNTVPVSTPPVPKIMSTNGEGITIVATDSKPHPGTSKCDDVSVMSINDRNKIFHISHHVLFPEVLDTQGHQSTIYSSDCTPSGMAGSEVFHGDWSHTEGATGTGDCHAPQMSINNAIQNPSAPK